MKKLLLSAAVMLCAATASAAVGDIRIYINPGHGCWCSECRHMGTVKHGYNSADTAGFFESNTNLQKGLGLFYKLKEYGLKHNGSNALDLTQNIVMSRIKNGGVHNGLYDRYLSEIAAEAELNNFDMFISIHSNAASEGATTNYPLFLYRGYDNSEGNPGSKAMAAACWPHWIKNKHMMWTHYTTSTNIRGDISYWNGEYLTASYSNGKTYSSYYGVLRQGVPGFLVEGYFHTYQPARHKAMNKDACRWEGHAYAKGINDYFGIGYTESTGTIYGVLRDAETTFTHEYYKANTSTLDRFLPINNATVTLKDSSGTTVATYNTDDEYNGVFVFFNVAPGTYTLEYSHPDYKDSYETVNVKANETVFPTPQISASTEQIPVRGHYAYDLSSTQNGDTYTFKFKSTGAFDKASIIFTNTSTGATQTVPTGAIAAGENTVNINAKVLGDDALFSWAVAIDNPKSSGVELIHSDNSIIYNNGTKDARIGLAIDKDVTSPNFGAIYTITAMGQGLQRYNPDFTKNGAKVLTGMFGSDTESSTSSNKYLRSNRMTVSNGKVYIANYANQNSGVWVYNPNGTTATNIINTYYERAVAFSGSGANRVMYASHESGLNYFNIGEADTWAGNASSPSGSYSAGMINGDGDMIATGKGIFIAQNRFSGNNTSDVPVFKFINYSGTTLFNSSTLSGTLTGSQSGGMAISSDLSTFAIVDGYSNPADIEVDIFNVIWSGETPSFTYQYSIPLSGTQQVDQMAFDHADNLVIASQQKGLLVYTIKKSARQTVTKATSTIRGIREPGVRGHYAYNLNMETSATEYTLTFKSTGAADNAYIVLTDINGDSDDTDKIRISIGAVVEGENSVTIDRTQLTEDTKFNWAVEIENPASPSVELIHSDNSIIYNNGTKDARIGLAIDKDVTSPNFGAIYTITAMGQGLQRYNPDFTKNGAKVLTGMFGSDTESSTSSNKYLRSNRMTVSNGKVYIANYANQNSGVWVYNPNGTTATNIINTYYERAVAFSGSGANRVMYASHESGLNYFNIGEADTWAGNASSPSGSYSAGMINGDGDMIATGKGIFIAQNRFSGNNTSDVPVFKFINYSGTTLFNSSTLSATLTGSQSGGMAISADLSTFVIADGYSDPSDIEIDVYNVTWNGETPAFTYQYSIPLSGTQQVDQMAFDHADNLVIASQQKGLLVYAIKNGARSTRTDANATQLLEYAPFTGIENISSNDNNTQAEYYNLQGIKIKSQDITSGIYIQVQDGKASCIKITR